MSKIESGLRLAKEQIAARSAANRDAAARNHSNGQDYHRQRPSEDTEPRLPMIVRLEPFTTYTLNDKLLAKNRVINPRYPEGALTSYKMLRTRILQMMRTNDWRTLGVTSPRDGAGKSLTAINLAIAMASHGAHDVYLLDLDLKKPTIGKHLGLPKFELDLGEFLAGRASMSRICCEVGIDNLRLLPSNKHQSNSSELITSQPMQGLLKTILWSANDPVVIIDLPSVLTADDALAISPLIDSFLMVVSESQTRREDVTRSLEMMRESSILGITLNKSSEK